MKIQVTAEDIANGRRSDCHNCPVSLAWNRVMGGDYKVGLGVIVQNSCILFWLPKIAQKFIFDFDAGRPVEPFEFEVNLP